jgi:hypothetical protein
MTCVINLKIQREYTVVDVFSILDVMELLIRCNCNIYL